MAPVEKRLTISETGSTSLETRNATATVHPSAVTTETRARRESDARFRRAERATVKLSIVRRPVGAVWRGDLMYTRGDDDEYWSFVSNLSYSWIWNDRNWSGAVEYFHNGFGLERGMTLFELQGKADLYQRLLRGELYTIGRDYLAANASVELNPLWIATPALFINLTDQSALLQLASQYNLAQNWQFTAAVNLPLGPDNTEYGGLNLGLGDLTLATEGGVFLQVGWYF